MRARHWALCVTLATLPQTAWAHSPVPGIEGFYTGLLHPFSTPSQALLMVALGLLVGSLRAGDAKWCFAAFLGAALAGIAVGVRVEDPDPALFGGAVLASAVAALYPKPVLPVPLVLAAVAGVLIGQVSITDPGPLRDRIITTSGSFVGAGLGLLYLFGATMYLRERFTQGWVDIALRVACAWVGAISLVMLALSIAAPDASV